MGYRLWILKATLSRNLLGTKLSLTWENDGMAPFYRDWPVWVYVTDEDGNTIEKKQVELSLSSIFPRETIETDTLLDTRKLFELAGENYHISIGVEDPMIGKTGLRFAMQGDYKDGQNFLW